ncbi:MAG TPA: hypothetical protein VMG09_13580 [Bacteroidota bacterium]|nr:hypothetical protein [Bacteroidota bacterium]
MNWQSVASISIVAVTAVLMVRGAFRRRTHKASCCDVCVQSRRAGFTSPLHRGPGA